MNKDHFSKIENQIRDCLLDLRAILLTRSDSKQFILDRFPDARIVNNGMALVFWIRQTPVQDFDLEWPDDAIWEKVRVMYERGILRP